MPGVETRVVTPDEDGMRLDRWFKAHRPALGHGALQKLLRKGQIRVDGKRAKANDRLASGQDIRIPPTPDDDQRPHPTMETGNKAAIHDWIIHEDDHVIAINKPAGVPVQGGTKSRRHIDGMLDALSGRSADRPRLVHRLDKDTSGVLLLARSRKAAQHFAGAFADRRTEKTYWALVTGVPRPEEGEITSVLAKQGNAGRQRVKAVRPDEFVEVARKAVTEYVTIDQAAPKFAWLAMRPVTGRTHQLRVHAAELGHPIVGDPKYGGEKARAGGDIPNRLHLHARRLTVVLPTGRPLTLEAPLPTHMKATWKLLNFDANLSADPFSEDGHDDR